MDPATITIICAIVTLIIERVFSRIKESDCCGMHVELDSDNSTTTSKTPSVTTPIISTTTTTKV